MRKKKSYKLPSKLTSILTTWIPIIIATISLLISYNLYRNQGRKDMPFLRIKYCTVMRNRDAPRSLLAGKVKDFDTQRSLHLSDYFYRPLREALGDDIKILESVVLTDTDAEIYSRFDELNFMLIENLHAGFAGRIDLELYEDYYHGPPIPQEPKCSIYRRDLPIPDKRKTLQLPGLKSGEMIALPLSFSKPEEGLECLFDKGKVMVDVQVKRITYFDETFATKVTFTPRPKLETSLLIHEDEDNRVEIRVLVDKRK